MKRQWLVLGISAILTIWATPAVAGWSQEARLLANDRAANDLFGESVSISGGTAIVGAVWDDDNGLSSGSAYIFKDSGTGWAQAAKLLAADGAAYDQFGRSVSISGGTAIVGAEGDDDNGYDSGSAYLFKDTGTGWVQAAKLLAGDGAASDHFGQSVSISGGTAIVGAMWDDDNGSWSGSAYIFQDTGSGWTQEAKLVADDGVQSDYFGYSVSISGGKAIVGAYGDADKGSDSGSAYIFQDTGSGWDQVAKLVAADGAAADHFGFSVSISGGTAIVGADGDDDKGPWSGSAYIFQDTGTGWTQEAKLLAADAVYESDHFGFSVSISGGTGLVGARSDDNCAGSAYIFTPEPATLLLLCGGAAAVLANRKRKS